MAASVLDAIKKQQSREQKLCAENFFCLRDSMLKAKWALLQYAACSPCMWSARVVLLSKCCGAAREFYDEALSRLLARYMVCACAIDFNSTLIITGEGWKSTLGVWAREMERTARLTLVSPGGTLSLFLVSQKLMHKNKMREKQKRVGGVSQCRVSLLVRLSKALLHSWG
jgi:hypothetical protein